jgi:16S rRNA (uracil1498-N3)-methyltransferase
MKRIFQPYDIKDIFTVDDDYLHYLKNVIRAKSGDEVTVLTPSEIAVCRITDIGKKGAVLRVAERRPARRHDYSLKVYQCLLKREYMDFAVEKYAELGATEIVPVVSARSLNDLKDKTMQRFTDIAVKAVLQSENEQMPVISEVTDIADIKADMDSNVLFYERYEGDNTVRPSMSMSMVVGPEGGFTDDEYEMLVGRGFVPVKPVRQILKAQTASVVFTGYIRILQESL